MDRTGGEGRDGAFMSARLGACLRGLLRGSRSSGFQGPSMGGCIYGMHRGVGFERGRGVLRACSAA